MDTQTLSAETALRGGATDFGPDSVTPSGLRRVLRDRDETILDWAAQAS